MEEDYKKRLPRGTLVLCHIILLVLITLTVIGLLVPSPAVLLLTALLAGLIFVPFLGALLYELQNARFEENEICLCFGRLVLRRIPYSLICGITVDALYVSGRYGGTVLRDRNRKPRGALCLYQAGWEFLLSSNSTTYVPARRFRGTILGSCFLTKRALWALLCKTELPIYISEQILTALFDELKSLLETYPERFAVAYRDKATGKETLATYAEYRSTMTK